MFDFDIEHIPGDANSLPDFLIVKVFSWFVDRTYYLLYHIILVGQSRYAGLVCYCLLM